MARYCHHSGCQFAISKRRLGGATCPECGYALQPSHSSLRYIVFPVFFSLVFLMAVRLCGPVQPEPGSLRTTKLTGQPRIFIPEETIAPALPDAPLPQQPQTPPDNDIYKAAERLADSVKLTKGQSAATLAAMLSRRGTPDEISDPELLAAIIYRWVAINISYDVVSLNPSTRAQQDPDRVLRDRKAVCEGYACLSDYLLSQNHIESRIVHGIAKTDESKIGRPLTLEANSHAWLIVKWNGQWHILEPTWASGCVSDGKFEGDFTWDWFDTNPAIAVYTHIPDEDWMQLLKNPFSKSEIEQAAIVDYHFFRSIDVSPLPLMPVKLMRGADSPNLTWKPRQGYRLKAEAVSFKNSDKKQYAAKTFVLPTGFCEFSFPSLPPGEYTLRVFAGKSTASNLDYCASFLMRQTAISSDLNPPVTFHAYNDIGAQLIEPLRGSISAETWQQFTLRAESGLSLALQFEGESTLHYLAESEGNYESKILLRPGKLCLWHISGNKMNAMVEFSVK